MAAFTVRIVLHNAEWDDYSKLYEEMDKEGFTDELSSESHRYKMPDGEYHISGAYEKSDVLQKAKNAVSKTGKKYSILVTESKGRTWYNLKKL